MSETWSLPGGNVEKLESDFLIEQTLKQEIREEVGVEINDDIVLIYNNGFFREADKSHVVNLTFLCKWKSGEARTLEDTSEIGWFTIEELKLLNKPEFLEREVRFLQEYLKV